jgi:hypothetical protein
MSCVVCKLHILSLLEAYQNMCEAILQTLISMCFVTTKIPTLKLPHAFVRYLVVYVLTA